MEYIVGYRIKVVERAGTPSKLLVPLERLHDGTPCGREKCITCTQEGENKIPPCTKRNLMYENICLKCNPNVVKEGGKVTPPKTFPSIYIGETSRSIAERGKEHWRGYMEGKEDNHIWKHHVLHHGGEGHPNFLIRPIQYFKSALTRQVAEAVRIGRLGEGVVLNSKSEFNRCKLGRLTLGDSTTTNQPTIQPDTTTIENNRKEQEAWEAEKAANRRKEEYSKLKKGRLPQQPCKRTTTTTTPPRKVKKRSYELIQDGWGTGKDDQPEKGTPSQLPQRPSYRRRKDVPPKRMVDTTTPTKQTTLIIRDGQPALGTSPPPPPNHQLVRGQNLVGRGGCQK